MANNADAAALTDLANESSGQMDSRLLFFNPVGRKLQTGSSVE